MALLDIKNLHVSIGTESILSDVSLQLNNGEILGIAGESGSGKTMTAMAIGGLLPSRAVLSGDFVLDGQNLSTAGEREYCKFRGNEIGIVFQEPMSALNPLMTIGDQVAETARIHSGGSRQAALRLARTTLAKVGLPEKDFPLDRYPHSLSGGQRQRVAIAIAMVLKPGLLIADEPTTALDVTTQAEISTLFKQLVVEDNIGLILVTHDLAVIAQTADRVAVMNAGKIVDTGSIAEVFQHSTQPYTCALLQSAKHVSTRIESDSADETPVLEVRNVVREYTGPKKLIGQSHSFRAVDDVSLTLHAKENVGLVGESGCGKSTLLRTVLGLDKAQAGEIRVFGRLFPEGTPLEVQQMRRRIQVVFQDPYGSFDPRWRVHQLIGENLHLFDTQPTTRDARKMIDETLEKVGLQSADAMKFPHEFSGGQRQRIAIARALITEPAIIALDEAVSALDVSIRAKILDLLADLSERLGMSYLFVTHDLSVMRSIADRVLVMKDGQIVEQGRTEDVFERPQHPYTATLLAAMPDLDRALQNRSIESTSN